MLQYSPKIVTDSLVMCLDASNNKSYPTDLPVKNGLLVWLDAADDSTFSYSSGTEVSQWRDKSGNNLHANQATTANQPSRSAVVNSRKSVNFTSTNGDFIRIPSGVVFSKYFTAVVLIKPGTQSADYAVILDQDHSTTGYQGWVIQRGSTTSFWQTWVANSSATNWTNANQIAYVDNTSQIVTLRKTSSTLALYSNGTSSGDVSINDYNLPQAGLYGLNIGYWSAGGGRYYNGNICEILIYNRDLTTTELKQVHTYLGQKWGISNTDRSIVDLSNNNIASFGGAAGSQTVANMPTFDFYNKGALRFDGGDYVQTTTTVLPVSHTSPFTLEAFCCPSTVSVAYQTVLGTMSSFSQIGFVNNTFAAGRNGGGGGLLRNSLATVVANTWYHICMTYNGTNASFYLNGSFLSTQTIGTNGVNNGVSLLGSYSSSSPSETFNGTIAAARIYNKALSAAEVLQNYEAQKSKFANTIVQQGLMLHLDAENPYSYAGAGTVWYDVSGNNNYFQLTNSPAFISTEPKTFNLSGASQHFLYYASIGAPTGNTGLALPSSNSWTCAFWFRTSTTNSNRNSLLSHMGSGPVYSLMGVSNSVLIYYHYDGNNGGWLTKSATTNVADNNWRNAVFVNTNNTMTIYLNGVLEKSSFSSTATNANNYVNGLGGSWESGFFTGSISTFVYYNTNLSAAQVLQNYNATKGRFGL